VEVRKFVGPLGEIKIEFIDGRPWSPSERAPRKNIGDPVHAMSDRPNPNQHHPDWPLITLAS
jgi:hypothetical protein